MRRSTSPPKPLCREASACQAEAGSGLLPCSRDGSSQLVAAAGASTSPLWRTAGAVLPPLRACSSSKKTGPVSSTAGGTWAGVGATAAAPGGGAGIASPSAGAGLLVPGTHAAPFQYRM